jgi:glutaredoxin-like protein NrdH
MTKALLSRRGVEFDVRDIENDPTAFEELQALGLMSVPVVVAGDRHVVGWNPTKVGELVGFEAREVSTTPEHMLSTIRTLLDASLRAVAQIPEPMLTWKSPDRDRPLRQLVHHMFRNYELGVDADVLGEFPARTTWRMTRDVPTFDSTARLVRYGETVRAKFNQWYSVHDPAAFSATIDADVGPRTMLQVLERTRLHSAFHLRQVYAFLEAGGVKPIEPITLAEMRQMGLEDLPDDIDIRPPGMD